MKLDHLNLPVDNVKEAYTFLNTYFGLQPFVGKPNDTMALLRDDDGLVLNLSNFDKATSVSYPSTFHIGFQQESETRVNEINQQFRDDGFDVEPPKRFHGSWTFYLDAPGGFLVEVLYTPQAVRQPHKTA